MIKQRIQALSGTPFDLTYTGVIDPLTVLSVQNIMDSGYAYLGGENVSINNYGHKLYPGQSFTIELAPNDKLFAVGDSGVSVAIFTLDI
jgi:hypothetical protein